MSWKHNTFNDSAVMRSLEKVAKEKGLVTEQDFVKQTSAPKIDLTPTHDLMINILKLCDGLRNSGFSKYADEVENKFIGYKRADNSLYDVSKETGEDLVETAHPEGSHQLEGLDGDGSIVEDILDKHLKMLKVVEKTPLGKSSSSQDIINAVKVVLADPTTLAPVNLTGQHLPIPTELTNLMTAVDSELDEIASKSDVWGMSQMIKNTKSLTRNPTLNNLKGLLNMIGAIQSKAKPGLLYGGDEEDVYNNVIEPNLARAAGYVEQARNIRIKYEQQLQILKSREQANVGNTESGSTPVTLQSPLYIGWLSAVKGALQNLEVWSQTIPVKNIKPSTKANMLKWIAEQTALLTKYKNSLESAPDNAKDEVVGQLHSEIKQELDFVAQFRQQLSGM